MPSSWQYSPPAAGRALYSGGWFVSYSLGKVSVSPEFEFPLQLVYFTGREQSGLFGSQWFCPQLESSLMPIDKGYLLWTMPSGQQVILEKFTKGQSDFRSQDDLWRCEIEKSLFKIFNQEGWQYHYSKGKLVAVLSPTGRVLEFAWQARKLSAARLKDSASPSAIEVLQIAYNGDGNAIGLKLQGHAHEFAYREILLNQKLSAWDPPVGETAQFLYRQESGVLWKAGLGDPDKPKEIETFITAFIDPVKNKLLESESRSERKPFNYWLKEDQIGKYEYGQKADPKNKQKTHIDPSSVTLTHRTGLVEKSSFAANRGVITSSRDGAIRNTYYYRAPGKPYDGKLRSVTENDKTVLEYTYDHKTGLLIETTDAQGISTYYDYDPKFRRVRGEAWEPRPLRIRRGKFRKNEIIAEYRYLENGKIAAVKDRQGNLTQYSYNSRGEITAIKTPAGDVFQYDYDALGRQVSVSSGERTEKIAYNENGRLSSRVAADGTKTEILYDALGHQTQIKRNGEVVKEIVRDEFQRVIGEKDALNRLSRTERDERGNLTAEIAPNGSITRYEYDSTNRRTAQIDGNGNKISFEYDKAGRLIKQSNAIGGTQTWKYDPKSGQLIERSNGEQTIAHRYSDKGYLENIDYGNGQSIAYTRDDEGRILTATSPDSSIEQIYNSGTQLSATRAIQGETEQLLNYQYNLRGQRSGLIISQLIRPKDKPAFYQPIQQTEQSYDASGLLTAIHSNGIPVISYQYDRNGRCIQKTYGYPKGGKRPLSADIAYDSAGHLASMKFQGASLSSPLELHYSWDSADQLTSRSWNGQSLRYQYDPSGQLLKVSDASDKRIIEAYRYDLAGNMLAKILNGQLGIMTYNAANQLSAAYDFGPADLAKMDTLLKEPQALPTLARDHTNYRYDQAGRLLGSKAEATATEDRRYGWLDKLITHTLPDGRVSTYRYWPDGQLASISTPTPKLFLSSPETAPVVETFLWDGLALLRRNDTIYLIEPHASGGIPIASHPVGKPQEITYHLNDLLGTTLASVGPAGLKLTSLSSFGQPLKAKTNAPNTSSPRQPSDPNQRQSTDGISPIR